MGEVYQIQAFETRLEADEFDLFSARFKFQLLTDTLMAHVFLCEYRKKFFLLNALLTCLKADSVFVFANAFYQLI